MKRIILLLSLLLAPSAFADDAVTSFGWNSVTSTFQAKLAALGWKNIPEHTYGTYSPALTATGGGTLSGTSANLAWTRIGKQLFVNGPTAWTTSGTVNSITFPLPNSYSCTVALTQFIDQYSSGNLCRLSVTGTTATLQDFGTGLSVTAFTGAGGCNMSFSCQLSN